MLTASDLNASFAYITTNALAAISPLTGALDCDGQILVLDADADSSLQAASDDILTLKLQGASLFIWNGATASAVNGVTMTAAATGTSPTIAAAGSDTNIDLTLRGKGTGGVDLGTVVNTTTFSSTLIHKLGADVASASALPVDVAGNLFDVTGTTAITSINSKGVGSLITLQFDGALTLTHHATDLILPGGANIATYAGYTAMFYEYASGDWRFVADNRAPYLTDPYTTTGGTSFEFTALPPWARRVSVMVAQMSGSSSFEVDTVLGTASGYETSSYVSYAQSSVAGLVSNTNSIPICLAGLAGYNYRGVLTLLLQSTSNTWVWDGGFQAGTGDVEHHHGAKTLADTLTKIKFTITFGTFDAMNVSLRIEP